MIDLAGFSQLEKFFQYYFVHHLLCIRKHSDDKDVLFYPINMFDMQYVKIKHDELTKVCQARYSKYAKQIVIQFIHSLVYICLDDLTSLS